MEGLSRYFFHFFNIYLHLGELKCDLRCWSGLLAWKYLPELWFKSTHCKQVSLDVHTSANTHKLDFTGGSGKLQGLLLSPKPKEPAQSLVVQPVDQILSCLSDAGAIRHSPSPASGSITGAHSFVVKAWNGGLQLMTNSTQRRSHSTNRRCLSRHRTYEHQQGMPVAVGQSM